MVIMNGSYSTWIKISNSEYSKLQKAQVINWKKQKLQTCRNNFKININTIERGKIDTPNKDRP